MRTSWENPWKTMGNSRKKHGKTWKNMGNHGKIMENEGFNGKKHLYIGEF